MIYSKNFSNKSVSSSLSNLCTLTLPRGNYILVSQIEFSVAGIDYYQQLSDGSNVFSKDAGCSSSSAPISNIASAISIYESTVITLSAKSSLSDSSVKGYLKALYVGSPA